MADFLAFLQNGFYTAGLVLLLLVPFLVVLFLYFRERQAGKAPRSDARDDLANMMILFQTMRDILEEQKGLARKLNQSLNKKVRFIKDTVDTAMKDLESLRSSVETVARDVQALKAGTAKTRGEGVLVGKAIQADDEEPEEKGDSPLLHVLAPPIAPDPSSETTDDWVGLDFGGDAPDPMAFEVPDEVPEQPKDAETAREAFRALLNLSDESPTPAAAGTPRPASPGTPSPPGQAEPAKRRGNGRGRVPPVQARVYEYSDAGMTVAQIAKELGVGKGEVRLMLSLREDGGR
ncbi:MAG: hypothetical protein GY851_13205 [bacterium]|nr:hypothetical protein [bacterium]